MRSICISLSSIVFVFASAGMVHASLETIGVNGINAIGLSQANGMPLNGDGIVVGQVEDIRPGIVNFDDDDKVNSDVQPKSVFIQDGGSLTANANLGDGHPILVAGVIISTDNDDSDNDGDVPIGIAPKADLYSGAYVTQGGNLAAYGDVIITTQYMAQTIGANDINHSWSKAKIAPGDLNDGNSQLTLGLDWIATRYDVLNIFGGYQPTPIGTGRPLPKDNFNGMTIGRSAKQNGVYRRVSAENNFTEDAFGDRTSIDLIAPGDGLETTGPNDSEPTVSGTSFAAPHVTGTATLLRQYAAERVAAGATNWGGLFNGLPTSQRHEVMKAVLMNSADKIEDTSGTGKYLGMERTVLDQNGNNWLQSEANDDSVLTGSGDIPLDDQMGAGHLNAKRALQQFLPGEFDSDGADIPSIGWDYGMTSGTGDTNDYFFSETLQAGSYISITLAWDRVVEFDIDGGTLGVFDAGDTFQAYTETDPYADDVISDLDLKLYGPTFLEGQSVSLEGTLEHIFFEIPVTGQYRFEVEQFDADAGPQNYGVAWWYGLAPELEPPTLLGDFDNDNDVDGLDFLAWQRDMSVGSLSDWENNYGTTSAVAATTTVPEPTSTLLMLTGLVFAKQLGPKRCRFGFPGL